MPRAKQPDLARLYHLNSSNFRPILPDLSLDLDNQPLRYRTYPGSLRIALPGADHNLPLTLGKAIEQRQSRRNFQLDTLPLATAGRLLYNSYGIVGTGEVEGEKFLRRPVPSAGGLNPLELYVATQNLEGVADGIYHYDAHEHALEQRRLGVFHPQLAEMTLGQNMIRSANLVILIAAVAERTMWKYGQRGYRYVLLDAGHIGQNIYLVSVSLCLNAVAIGGFFDQEANALCGLPAGEEVIYILCAGCSA
jgi:SagB-type dehydrogenase family enzyme